MAQIQQLLSSVSRAMELASNDEQACVAMQADLRALCDELNAIGNGSIECPCNGGAGIAQHTDARTNEDFIYDVKNSMSHPGAASFLIRNMPESQSLVCLHLSEIVRTLANIAGVYCDPSQLCSLQGICQFTDLNWEALEPKVSDLIIIDCSSRQQNDDEY